MNNEKTFQPFEYPEPSGFGQMSFDEDEKVIFVTNDDGYYSDGITALIESLRGLGKIIVCAPDASRSGFSSSFSATTPVSLRRLSDDGEVMIFACSGTPVDCVKIAMHRFFHVRKPDLIVSGINHGGNDSICVMYSGTMGAVLEGCCVGVPSIGFSILSHIQHPDFSAAVGYTRKISEQVLREGLPKGVVLNVNIPASPELKGMRYCRQAKGSWINEFHYISGDENNDTALFQVTGEYLNHEPEATDTDRYWLEHDYVSIVPMGVDYTVHQYLDSQK